jgi:hypothetical protein
MSELDKINRANTSARMKKMHADKKAMTDKQRSAGEGLLPCAHCGGAAEVKNQEPNDLSGGYYIECNTCGITTRLMFALMDDPIPILAEQWNKRDRIAALEQKFAKYEAAEKSLPPEPEWFACAKVAPNYPEHRDVKAVIAEYEALRTIAAAAIARRMEVERDVERLQKQALKDLARIATAESKLATAADDALEAAAKKMCKRCAEGDKPDSEGHYQSDINVHFPCYAQPILALKGGSSK